MAHSGFGSRIPQFGAHLSTRNRLKSGGSHEALRTGGHHHLNLGATFAQTTDQIRCLVRGDTSADPEDDPTMLQSRHRRIIRDGRSRRRTPVGYGVIHSSFSAGSAIAPRAILAGA
jgi:hypothetical protein